MGARVQDLGAGQILFLQEEPADALFIVLGGWIKLYRTAANGSFTTSTRVGRGTTRFVAQWPASIRC